MSLPLAAQVVLSALHRPAQHRYGPDPSQVADLHLPRRAPAPHPVAVLLHGGHWATRHGKLVCRPLALDLARAGWAVWNLEYRRVGGGRGGGGGWPATFEDVARGVDALATLSDPRLDLSRVALVGHSAGGQLALWAASRTALPADAVGSAPRVVAQRAVALAPVTQLRRSGDAARALLGGGPGEVPDRWRVADPVALLPPPVPVLVVHPDADATIPLARSQEYADRAVAAGGDVRLLAPTGEGHRDVIDPASASWRAARSWLAGAQSPAR